MDKKSKYDINILYNIHLAVVPEFGNPVKDVTKLTFDMIIGMSIMLYAILREDLEKYVEIKTVTGKM